MTQSPILSDLKNFALACLRLLYWTYFKPYTLRRHLRAIHPDLKEDSNPFFMRAEWETHPGLQPYAEQVWWTTALTPWAAMLLVGTLYSLLAAEPFAWTISLQFLLGWLVGLWIARADRKLFAGWTTRLLWIIVILVLLFGATRFFPDFAESVLNAIPVRIIQFGVTFIQAIAPFYGVAFGVAGGVALTICFLFGVLRIYFWLPELIWSLLIGLLSTLKKGGGGERNGCAICLSGTTKYPFSPYHFKTK